MTILTVKMRNPLYAYRKAYAQFIPEYNIYTGEVLPSPKWVGNKRFCLSNPEGQRTGDFRVLEKENIICGWLHESNK